MAARVRVIHFVLRALVSATVVFVLTPATGVANRTGTGAIRRLVRIDVKGNRLAAREEILNLLPVRAGADLSDTKLAETSETLRRFYAAHGYDQARISIEIRDTIDPMDKVLVLHIDEGPPLRVRHVVFEDGADGFDLGSLMDLHRGDVLSDSRVSEGLKRAIGRLRRRGHFAARLGGVQAIQDGREVTLRVSGFIGPRYAVNIRGRFPLSRESILNSLGLLEEGLASLAAIETKVVDHYQRHGFFSATAQASVTSSADRQTATLSIVIDPGPRLVIERIRFPGAKGLPASLLRDQTVSFLEESLPLNGLFQPVDSDTVRRIGFASRLEGEERATPAPLRLDPASVYYPPLYRKALSHIEELYRDHGYLSVKIGDPELHRLAAPSKTKARAEILVEIDEGPQTRLERFELAGNRMLTTQAIVQAFGLGRGDAFSYRALEEAKTRILEAYREAGHLYATIDSQVRLSEDRTLAAIRLEVSEGPLVTVSDVRIEGADRTSEELIRKRSTIQPGDLYRPSSARRTQEQLTDLGVFSSVTVAPEDPDTPDSHKTVIISVRERKPQVLDLSAGIATGQGARTGIEYDYRNLFGTALSLRLQVQLAFQFFFVDSTVQRRFEALSLGDRLERRVGIGLGFPWIPGIPSGSLSLDVSHQRNNERDFGINTNAVSVTLGNKWSRSVRSSLTSSLENNNVQLFVDEGYDEFLLNTTDPRLQRLLRVPEGESTLVAMKGILQVDMRDRPFAPTQGWIAGLSAEWARSLRTESAPETPDAQAFFSHHVRASFTAAGYLPASNHVVVATQVRAGRVFHLSNSSQTYPNRKFFLGGIDTIRGYRQGAMVPQDLADTIDADPNLGPNDVLRGGDLFLLLRGELRFPVWKDLKGGAFADLGNLWADAKSVAAADLVRLRPTAGLGLRLATPVGPLAFDYGVVLLRRRELQEPFGSFHFSIGVF